MSLSKQFDTMAIASATAGGDFGNANAMMCCASCGQDSDGLKKCTACKSVWYCNVECQKAHRKAHRKECKRIAEELEEEAVSAAAHWCVDLAFICTRRASAK